MFDKQTLKSFFMKTKLFSALAFCALTFGQAQILLQEGFDNVTSLTGWTQTNQSSPLGTSNWFQGNSTVFTAQTGAPAAYIGANFNNTAGAGTISNWLITPQLMVQDGDVLKFWTQTSYDPDYADRLEVRSSAGTTFTAPSGSTGLGSFTNLHLEINPTLSNVEGVYPDPWAEFTITVTGVSATPVAMNFAFRYFVTDGGPAGNNSNYIGIDTFSVERPNMAVTDVSKVKMAVYPNPTSDYLKINTTAKISSVEVFDISGKKVQAVFDGTSVDVQKLEKGSYVIKINGEEGTSTQKFIKK